MAIILSDRDKKHWEEIKLKAQGNEYFSLNTSDMIRMKKVLDLLQAQGYLQNLEVDDANVFVTLGNLQDFEDWFKDEEQQFHQKEQQNRHRNCQETRQLRASAIVNAQPTINGVHIMDASAEELLNSILTVYNGNDDRIVVTDSSVFHSGYRKDPMSTALEMEKLAMYGVVTSTQFFKDGRLKTVLTPQGLSYFKDKKHTVEISASLSEKPARKKYDVFISHANKDKLSYVNELYAVLHKLGIAIFYDSEVLSWGDKWKNVILDGTAQSEFAIIVISENFFGREWTEKELSAFLAQENTSGQTLILPLLYNITPEQLAAKYPALGDIHAISTSTFTKEEIALIFAKKLIQRYK